MATPKHREHSARTTALFAYRVLQLRATVLARFGVDPAVGLRDDHAVVAARGDARAGTLAGTSAAASAAAAGGGGGGGRSSPHLSHPNLSSPHLSHPNLTAFGFLSEEIARYTNGAVREVLRGGHVVRVASQDLVPGDIVLNLRARGKIRAPRRDYEWFRLSGECDGALALEGDEDAVFAAFERLPYARRAHFGEMAVDDLLRAQRQHAAAGNYIPADMLILELGCGPDGDGRCTVDLSQLTGSSSASPRTAVGGIPATVAAAAAAAAASDNPLQNPHYLWHKTQLLTGIVAKAIVLSTHEKTFSSVRSLAMMNGAHMEILIEGQDDDDDDDDDENHGEQDGEGGGDGEDGEDEEKRGPRKAEHAKQNCFPETTTPEQAAAATAAPRDHAAAFLSHVDDWLRFWDAFVLIFSQCAGIAGAADAACDERDRLQLGGFDGKRQRSDDAGALSGYDPAAVHNKVVVDFSDTQGNALRRLNVSQAPVDFEDAMRRLRLGHRFLAECLEKARTSLFMVRESCRGGGGGAGETGAGDNGSAGVTGAEFLFEEDKEEEEDGTDGSAFKKNYQQPSLSAVLALTMRKLQAMEEDFDVADTLLASCAGTPGIRMGAAEWTRYTLLLARGRAVV
jgi:hypothetical protein